MAQKPTGKAALGAPDQSRIYSKVQNDEYFIQNKRAGLIPAPYLFSIKKIYFNQPPIENCAPIVK